MPHRHSETCDFMTVVVTSSVWERFLPTDALSHADYCVPMRLKGNENQRQRNTNSLWHTRDAVRMRGRFHT